MKKNKDICPMKKTSIGGQALIEGIMMRGPERTAMAVRDPKGEIVIEKWENTSSSKGSAIQTLAKIPIIRGVINFALSMKSGYKSLMRSAEISGLEELEEEEKRLKAEKKAAKKAAKHKASEKSTDVLAQESSEGTSLEAEKIVSANNDLYDTAKDTVSKSKDDKKGTSPLMTVIGIFSMIFGVALAVLLFVWLPTFIYGMLGKAFPVFSQDNRYLMSAFEGIFKVIILIAYMGCVSLMKDIRRTFMYHGAEHKTIFCYEAGLELTVENVRKQKRFHPRCGTSFLIVMVLVGILISFLIPPSIPRYIRVCIRILLLPLVMGIGYEFIKFAGRHDNLFTKILSAPGLWFQRITVFEPTDDMIECAIAAVKEVIPDDGSDKW